MQVYRWGGMVVQWSWAVAVFLGASSFTHAGTFAHAGIRCHAFEDTDAGERELPLVQTVSMGTASFAYSEEATFRYLSADYTEGAEWILLSVQIGNTGTAADVAFRAIRGTPTAELIFTQYQPKTQWRVSCAK